MSKVEIYTTRYCPYCISAKALLTRKNVQFTEIDVSGDPKGVGTAIGVRVEHLIEATLLAANVLFSDSQVSAIPEARRETGGRRQSWATRCEAEVV